MNLAMDLIREALLGGSGGGGGGGGGDAWQQIFHAEKAYSTTVTSKTLQETITTLVDSFKTPNVWIWIHIRDKAGKRAGYFYGSDTIYFKAEPTYPSSSFNLGGYVMYVVVNDSGNYEGSTADSSGNYVYGVYGTVDGSYGLRLYTRYNASNSKTIDGTYVVDVYLLTPPDPILKV